MVQSRKGQKKVLVKKFEKKRGRFYTEPYVLRRSFDRFRFFARKKKVRKWLRRLPKHFLEKRKWFSFWERVFKRQVFSFFFLWRRKTQKYLQEKVRLLKKVEGSVKEPFFFRKRSSFFLFLKNYSRCLTVFPFSLELFVQEWVLGQWSLEQESLEKTWKNSFLLVLPKRFFIFYRVSCLFLFLFEKEMKWVEVLSFFFRLFLRKRLNFFLFLKKKNVKRLKKKKDSYQKEGLLRLVKHWITFKVTHNNAFLTMTNMEGEVLLWHSAGTSGFRGPRRATPYAARMTGISFFQKLLRVLKRETGLPNLSRGRRSRSFPRYPVINFGLLMKRGIKKKMRMVLSGFFQMMRKTKWLRIQRRLPNLILICAIRKEPLSHNGLRGRKKRRL